MALSLIHTSIQLASNSGQILESSESLRSTQSCSIEERVQSVAQTQLNLIGKVFSDFHGKQLSEEYFWEAVPVNSHHYYKDSIEPLVTKWAGLYVEGKTTESFQKWMESQDHALTEVRYFSDEDRAQTQVMIDSDGKLKQIGLDNELGTDSNLDGEYAFVIGKEGDFLQLHAAKKEKTSKGKVQHSSFFRGGDVRAAGMIFVERGVLKEIRAQSGHYQPGKKELARMVEYMKRELSTSSLSEVNVEYANIENIALIRAAFSGKFGSRMLKTSIVKHESADSFYESQGKALAPLKQTWIEMQEYS